MNKSECLFIVLALFIFANWGCFRKHPLTFTERDTIVTVRVDTIIRVAPPTIGERWSSFDNFFDTIIFVFPTHTATIEIERDWEKVGETVRLKNDYFPDTVYHECTDTLFIEKTTVVDGIPEGGGFPFTALLVFLAGLAVWWSEKKKKKAEASAV